MKAELLERLLDAGFSKDEIIQLARDEPMQPANPDTQKPEGGKSDEKQGKPDVEDKPGNEDKPDDKNPSDVKDKPDDKGKPDDKTGSDFEKRFAGIEKSINDLVKAVQNNNLKNDSFGANGATLEDETDKIMASIIRPEFEKKEGK